MSDIIIKEDIIPNIEQIIVLYEDVQWLAYTKEPETLKQAIDNSLTVWTAWDNENLIALARVVGDGFTIVYIQDLLVLKSYQGGGIGSRLLKTILEKYKSVRQIVLMTDDDQGNISFYKKNGLVNAGDYQIATFIKSP